MHPPQPERVYAPALIGKPVTRLDAVCVKSENRYFEREADGERVHGSDFLAIRIGSRRDAFRIK